MVVGWAWVVDAELLVFAMEISCRECGCLHPGVALHFEERITDHFDQCLGPSSYVEIRRHYSIKDPLTRQPGFR